jgi:hypothetical protein
MTTRDSSQDHSYRKDAVIAENGGLKGRIRPTATFPEETAAISIND